MSFYSYPNRTLCDVLAEMRKCYETHNYSSLMALVEEAQSMGNRMEAGLGDKRDIQRWTEERAELKEELKKLHEEKDKLKPSKK